MNLPFYGRFFVLNKSPDFFLMPSVWFVSSLFIGKRNAGLTSKTRKAVYSQYLFIPKRGEKKCDHFFLFVNHLNQRKSPSAPLLSQEIESEHRFVFFQKSRYSRELAVKSFLFDAKYSIRRTTRFAYRLSLARKLKTFLS